MRVFNVQFGTLFNTDFLGYTMCLILLDASYFLSSWSIQSMEEKVR